MKDESNNTSGRTENRTFLDKLIEKRLQLIEALDANKGEVNLEIFEDFYPDRAHFVYELLQNAEDAGATEVTFALAPDRLVCEHDGRRKFTEADVSAITGIHNSTKDKAQDRIGKFGVGFKSVFVYTQSPTVRSGDFAFRIVKLILPEPIARDPSIEGRTRFEFPFDNPRKPPEEAYTEIATGLNDLDETTLLFLSNLQTINWRDDKGGSGEVVRCMHTESHFEVLKRSGDLTTASSHFLKFDQAVPGLDTHRVAVAFPLDFLPGVREFDASIRLSEQLKIVPATPGRVAVFFTAAKETSGLLFHLHGPFVPELSRASLKETAANEPLLEQIAGLCAQSLHKIRDLDLLTPDFLAVLPNPQDQIPLRYQRIRDVIVAEMKAQPLTPTQARSHAAANRLIQAKASLKDLLSDDDIEFLVGYENDPPLWVIGAAQKNGRTDNFLSGLEIQDWSIERFVETLQRGASTKAQYFRTPPHRVTQPDEAFMRWLAQKSPEWTRQFYALLNDESIQSGLMHQLKTLKIVRLRGGDFGVATQSFFPSESTGDGMPTVDAKVYTSGKSKPQQEKAKKFLSDLGVRELGEAEEVELILKARYTKEAEIPDEKTYRRDFKRFVALIEKQPETKTLFAPYYIFQGEDQRWYGPESIYLDRPFKETDLSAYYSRLGEDAECASLHSRYTQFGVAIDRIGKFAEAVGSRVTLQITEGGCRSNPQWSHLAAVGGDRHTSPIDRDWYVPELSELLEGPSVELSRLIWRTLTALPANYLRATYQRNNSWGAHYADSQLIHDLRAREWVPQEDGVFVRPAEASSEALPEGFPYDPGYRGLKAVNFGTETTRRLEREREKDGVAASLGFSDRDSLERAKRFAALPPAEQEKILAAHDNAARTAMPDREPANPERRAQNVLAQALVDPDKESEIRSRSVSIGRESVKEEADQYLRQHYRNARGEMTCQICKGPLPFKLDDGTEFFEVVECFPGLTKRHHQNYLALCPNHSAMYRFANGSMEEMLELFEKFSGNELEIILAQQEATIYFSKIHILDLKSVLAAERRLSASSNPAHGFASTLEAS